MQVCAVAAANSVNIVTTYFVVLDVQRLANISEELKFRGQP